MKFSEGVTVRVARTDKMLAMTRITLC